MLVFVPCGAQKPRVICNHDRNTRVKIDGTFLFFFFFFLKAAPAAYGDPQARGQIGAAAAGLHRSHSNVGSEPHLRPTPQLTATPDP